MKNTKQQGDSHASASEKTPEIADAQTEQKEKERQETSQNSQSPEERNDDETRHIESGEKL